MQHLKTKVDAMKEFWKFRLHLDRLIEALEEQVYQQGKTYVIVDAPDNAQLRADLMKLIRELGLTVRLQEHPEGRKFRVSLGAKYEVSQM